MASSSGTGQYEQQPPPPPQAPAEELNQQPASMFAEFLELVKKKPHWLWPWAAGKSMHPEMLKPVHCGHCGQLEDLSRSPTPIPDATNRMAPPDHQVTVPDAEPVEQVVFKGNSCLTCAKMIYEKTREQLCQPSSEQAPSDTPLHYAARSRNFKMLFHFICLLGNEYGLGRVAQVVRKLNSRRETALHEAIWQGNMYMAELLMRVDPELALYPPAGTSPLYLAVSLGYKHIARMLLSRSDGNLSYSGPDGQNALHAAALHEYGMIQMLLYWKADLSKEMDTDSRTPLHYVVSGQTESLLFRICCFRFANIWFPLEKFATWRVLRANTSAARQQDKNGLYPVHIAALMNRKAAIRVLLRGCPGCIGFRDNQGRSFLHIAVQNKSSSVVRYACQESRFASIMNAQDKDGNTALHLAVEEGDLWVFCALLANREVLLNIRNNKDQTPLDLASSKKGEDFSYRSNPEWVIHRTLIRVRARSCSIWRDRLQQLCNSMPLDSQEDAPTTVPTTERKESQEDKEKKEKKEEKEKEESAKVTDSARTIGIGSVLIASVSFAATFTVPAGIKASDNTKDGTPRLLGTWYFNAFMMANMLAFICSFIATVGLMFAGMPIVKLPIRLRHLVKSFLFFSSSLTCLSAAFALGLYMVLAPVGRLHAIAIGIYTPLVLVYRNVDHVQEMVITSWPIYVRRGFMFACCSFIWNIFVRIIMEFLPLGVIFVWALYKDTSSTRA